MKINITDQYLITVHFIEAYRFDYVLGCAVQYIAACHDEEPYESRENLESAIWYLDRVIYEAKNGMRRHQPVTTEMDVTDLCKEIKLSFELCEALYGICLFQKQYEKDMAHFIHVLETVKGNIKLHLEKI